MRLRNRLRVGEDGPLKDTNPGVRAEKVEFDFFDTSPVNVGDRVHIIFWWHTLPPQHEGYELSTLPGRKNLSREVTLVGWLGETCNISRTAEGVGTVIEINRLNVVIEMDPEEEV